MREEYDVIIIGAGVGGLVCGCYLAKDGIKVLIIEQHNKPGGYCTSFGRKGFVFDAAVHALGSCRRGGQVDRLVNDLSLFGKIELIRSNPSDIIVTPDYRVRIMNDIEEVILQLATLFPREVEHIRSFINFVVDSSFYKLLSELKGVSFDDLLNRYFNDYKLKTLFKILSGCLYEPSYKLSALSTSILFKEFIFDGGYYPKGGMQAFSNALEGAFRSFGGNILLRKKVSKIRIKNKKVQGVIVDDDYVTSKYVVSNCDVRETFLELIGKEHFKDTTMNKVNNMKVSAAPFVTYLGVNSSLSEMLDKSCTYWFTDTQDIDSFFLRSQERIIYSETYLICGIPSFSDRNLAPANSTSLYAITGAPFKNKEFWKKNRSKFSENIINKLDRFIPGISNSIVFKETATPSTFYKYTLNSRGAFRGWAPIVNQDSSSLIRSGTEIRGLFLTGHWVTQPGQGGIPMVISSGRITANLIKEES